MFNHCSLAKFGRINGKLGDGHQCSPVSESDGYRLSTCDTVPLGSYNNFQPGWAGWRIPGSMHPVAVASDGDFRILMP